MTLEEQLSLAKWKRARLQMMSDDEIVALYKENYYVNIIGFMPRLRKAMKKKYDKEIKRLEKKVNK